MPNTPDYAKMMQDAAAAFKFDTSKIQEAFKTSAGYGEKLTKVALSAAEESTELSAKWTRETLAKLGDVSKSKDAPTEYGQAMSEFAQAQATLMNDQMAAFADIAKKVQTETVELIMEAAKTASTSAQDAVRTATEQATATAKKTTK
jgi:hypothetical protein